jgi:hypothetical protein
MDAGTKQIIENKEKKDKKYRDMIDEKSIENRILELCEKYEKAPVEAFTGENSDFYQLFMSRSWLATLLSGYIKESQQIDKEKSVKLMDALVSSDDLYETHLFNTTGKKPVRWF